MNLRNFFIKYFDFFRTVAAVIIGFGISLLCLVFVSKDPGTAISRFMLGPFSNMRRFLNMIEFVTPIIFTSLGMCMMFQVKEYNLIGEGAFFICGAFAAFLGCKILPASLPPVLFPAIIITLCSLLGAILAMIPALLKIKWNTNQVVITIMLNYVLVWAGIYILTYWMRDSGVTYLGSLKIAQNARLHKLIPRSQVDTGFLVAIAVNICVYFFLFKTKPGFAIRVTGNNRSFSQYAGIGVTFSLLVSQFIGGTLAGMGGAMEILGKYDRFKWIAQTGYGFDGLMVAVIAKNNPAYVPIAAFFLAYIRIGSDIVGSTTDVPVQFVMIIQGIVIILAAAAMLFDSFRKQAVVKLSMAGMGD
jgi:simple sugar transport system permease protein